MREVLNKPGEPYDLSNIPKYAILNELLGCDKQRTRQSPAVSLRWTIKAESTGRSKGLELSRPGIERPAQKQHSKGMQEKDWPMNVRSYLRLVQRLAVIRGYRVPRIHTGQEYGQFPIARIESLKIKKELSK